MQSIQFYMPVQQAEQGFSNSVERNKLSDSLSIKDNMMFLSSPKTGHFHYRKSSHKSHSRIDIHR